MKTGILGSGLAGGKIGTTLARLGHEVEFSYARSRDKLGQLARMTRRNVMAGSSLNTRIASQRPVNTEIERGQTRSLRALSLLLGLSVLGVCEAGPQAAPGQSAAAVADAGAAAMKPEESRMWMTVGERRFAITLADTPAARALSTQLPLTLDMAELNGNEKHGNLLKALPMNASRPGTIRTGDLMLYGTNTLVVFYLTFDSSYSYTRLGRVDDPAGLAQALGRRGVRVVFSKDQ